MSDIININITENVELVNINVTEPAVLNIDVIPPTIQILNIEATIDSELVVQITQNTENVNIEALGTRGDPGKEVEFRVSGTILQWRYVGDIPWEDVYDLSGSSPSNVTNAVVRSFVTAEDIIGGNVVMLDSSGNILKYNNIEANYGKLIGIANHNALTGNDLEVVISGYCAQMTGLTVGNFYYATTAGAITDSIPSDVVQIIGIALSATEINIQIGQPVISI